MDDQTPAPSERLANLEEWAAGAAIELGLLRSLTRTLISHRLAAQSPEKAQEVIDTIGQPYRRVRVEPEGIDAAVRRQAAEELLVRLEDLLAEALADAGELRQQALRGKYLL